MFTKTSWNTCSDERRYTDYDGSLMEQRQCPFCQTHMTIALVDASKPEDLPSIVRLVAAMGERFTSSYSLEELLRLITIYRKVSGVCPTVPIPSEWTHDQINAALAGGTIPEWEEGPRGLHALNVRDCVCGACQRTKAVTTSASFAP